MKKYIVEIMGTVETYADSKLEAAEKAKLEVTSEMMEISEINPKGTPTKE